MKTAASTVYALLFCLAIGMLPAVWMFSRGGLLTALVTLAGAVSLASFTMWILRMKLGDLTAQVNSAAEGTTVRPDRFGDLMIRTSMSSGVSAMALFAILQPLGMLDMPVPHSMRYSLPLMSSIGALAGAPVVIRAFTRGSMSYLRLTRKGFEFAEWRTPERGRWSDIDDVAGRAPNRPEPRGPSIVMVMRDGTAPTIAVGAYCPEGSAVRRMVQFYWKHPDRRDELTDGRAVQRLRDDDFGQARRKLG